MLTIMNKVQKLTPEESSSISSYLNDPFEKNKIKAEMSN